MTAVVETRTHDLDSLERQLGRLVLRRQELRAQAAGRDVLEPNRREIVRLQQRVTAALIELHVAAPARPAVG